MCSGNLCAQSRTSFYLRMKIKFRGFSPRANYTDRATAACRRIVLTFADKECCVVSTTDAYGSIPEFIGRLI
jgi:hypothetical protein